MFKGAQEHTERVHAALELLLPHLRPVAAEKYFLEEFGEGELYQHLSLIESTLSHKGIYSVVIQAYKGLYGLCKTTHGHSRIIRRGRTLKDLLDYIEQTCFYKVATDVQR